MADAAIAIFLLVLLAVLILILLMSIRVVRPYEVGILTILGSYRRTLKPGFNIVSPLGRVVRVDLRLRRVNLPQWNAAMGTNPVLVAGSVSYRVEDAPKATFQVRNLDDELRARARAIVNDVLLSMNPPLSGAPSVDIGSTVADRLNLDAAAIGVRVESATIELTTPRM